MAIYGFDCLMEYATNTLYHPFYYKDGYGYTFTFKNYKDTPEKRNLDKWAEEQNYDAAQVLDDIGVDALNIYNSNKQNKFLNDKCKNYSYKYTVRIEGNQKYFTFEVFGNKYKYTTYGEKDYTDDQTFSEISEDDDMTAYGALTTKKFKSLLVKACDNSIKECKVSDEDLKYVELLYKNIIPKYIRKDNFGIPILKIKQYWIENNGSEEEEWHPRKSNFPWLSKFKEIVEKGIKAQCDNISSIKIEEEKVKNEPSKIEVHLYLKQNFADSIY